MEVSRKKQRSDTRLDFRLNRQVKEVIERSAAVSGQSVSEFAVSALYRTAIEVLEKGQVSRLSNRDRDVFLAMLDSDATPVEALKRAAKKYKSRE
jgi:uncharacterized protein (DUF1778 family)